MFGGCQPVSFQVGDYNPGSIGAHGDQIELEYDLMCCLGIVSGLVTDETCFCFFTRF